jgi:hypothetical protein
MVSSGSRLGLDSTDARNLDAQLWILYFDRQGIVQSDGIHLIQDLPRFMVLLLAFQRFDLEDWGVVTALNPKAELVHNPNPPVPQDMEGQRRNPTRADDKARENHRLRAIRAATPKDCVLDVAKHLDLASKDDTYALDTLKIHTDELPSYRPQCLAGRATTVVNGRPVKVKDNSSETQVVCKIYHPEVARENEGDVIQHIYKKVAKDPDMRKHLPTMLLCGDIRASLTNRVRSFLGISWKGHRTMRLIVFIKLQEITELTGEKFIKAWLEIVKCEFRSICPGFIK